MPACTALGVKSRINVAFVGCASGAGATCDGDRLDARRMTRARARAARTEPDRQCRTQRGCTTAPPARSDAPASDAPAVAVSSNHLKGSSSTHVAGQQAAGQQARTLSGEPVRELYTPADLPAGIGDPERDPIGAPRLLPVHARRVRVDVSRTPVDDAPVRGLRHQRGDQRALPLPARPRPDRPVDRL